MASFKVQVEDLIGSVGDDSLITQSLIDSGTEIINAIPSSLLLSYSDESSITSSGLTINNRKILEVHKDSYIAREVSWSEAAKYKDNGSIHYSSSVDPIYYLKGEKVYIVSAGSETSGKLIYVPKRPTADGTNLITHSTTATQFFPLEAEYLMILGGAIKCLQRLLSDKTSSLPSDISSPSLPVAPSSPSAPSFTYTDASVSDIVQPLVSVSDMAVLTEDAPSYVPPVLTLGAAPAISDLSIISVAPSIPTLSSNSVTFNVNAPVYTPPVVAPSFGTVDTFISIDEDVELAGTKIQEINSQIAEYQANIQNELNKFNDSNVEYQSKLQVALKDSDLSQADDSQLIQKFQSEIQLYQANVAKEVQQYQQNLEADLRVWQAERSTDLQKYSTDIQNALNSFNESNVVYQQDVQRKSQNFQKDIQVAIQNAQQEFTTRKSILDKDVQLELQNAINNFQKEVQEYGSTLSKYQADNQKYQAEVGSTMQKYSSDVSNYGAKIQKQSIDYQWKQGQYNQLRGEYNQGLQILISGGMPQQQGA
tara:strand:+ start:539 stop:2146 length:1608 start_codon:yes stop_codon:yes gene_type:complete